MKTCSLCRVCKPLEEFYTARAKPGGFQSRCKECSKQSRKEYYKTAHGKETNDVTGKRWAAQMRKKVYEYLTENPCIDCAEPDPVVLEFDHRDTASKEFAIADGIRKGYGWARLLSEIEKCDVRCANCHRRRTARQFGHAKLAWQSNDVLE